MMSKKIETKQRILRAARELLESGDQASMGAIAERAGVTRQLLYLHFAGRADLLVELARQVDSDARTPEVQAAIDGAATGRQALMEAVAVQGHIKPRIYGVASAIDEIRSVDPAAATAWDEREEARYQRCEAVLQRLDREGALNRRWPIEVGARLMWSVTSLRAWEELVIESGWSTDDWVVHTRLLLENALVHED